MLVALLAFATYILGGATARAGPPPVVNEKAADSLIEFFLNPREGRGVLPPALSVSIGRDGKLLFAKGYGEAHPGHKADAATVYRIGSITKQFTAAAILRSIGKGARTESDAAPLTLETSATAVLDNSSSWSVDDAPPITIRNLLSMTSNLPNFTHRPPRGLDPWGTVPASALRNALTRLSPSDRPGTFEYSNTSYFLLAEILEAITIDGQTRTYAEALRQDVFEPFGLKSSGLPYQMPPRETLAHPTYRRRPAFIERDWLKGSGDAASTVVDLFAWNVALMRAHAANEAWAVAMLAEQARVDVWTYYGMGWFITHKNGADQFFHTGSVPGYTSLNMIVVDGDKSWTSVSILTNSDGVAGLEDLGDELARLATGN